MEQVQKYRVDVVELKKIMVKQNLDKIVDLKHFQAFTANKRSKKSTVRNLEESRIEKTCSASMRMKDVQDEICFTYSGNGFLYHMVRIMTGTLLEVGMHKREPADMTSIISSGNRENAGELVPAKGLTLMEVRY